MNMNRIGAITTYRREMDRFKFQQGFYRDPWKWMGKWMVGRVVHLLYTGIPIVLFLCYYYIFVPWRDK
jgi:hypothetical protein